jgi:hypothetical protein
MEARLVDLVNLYLLVPKRGETIARVLPAMVFIYYAYLISNTVEILKKGEQHSWHYMISVQFSVSILVSRKLLFLPKYNLNVAAKPFKV